MARVNASFVVFDCGAVPPNLVESEPSEHERGAFHGRARRARGRLPEPRPAWRHALPRRDRRAAARPAAARLLRALDSRTGAGASGASRDRVTDVRIIAATNRDLAALGEAKQFRQDLYFRLAAAVVQLPPLRERLEDLPLLVPQLLTDLGRGFVHVPDATYEQLAAHRWPGNVRELKNVLAYALAFVDAGVLEPAALRFAPETAAASSLERLPLGGQSLAALEDVAIRQTLALTRGNKVQAARLLGIATSTLYEKLKRHGF